MRYVVNFTVLSMCCTVLLQYVTVLCCGVVSLWCGISDYPAYCSRCSKVLIIFIHCVCRVVSCRILCCTVLCCSGCGVVGVLWWVWCVVADSSREVKREEEEFER